MTKFDNLIAAIGKMPVGTGPLGVALAKGDFIRIVSARLATDKGGVFVGGDVATGPASIIDAIAQDRKAAVSIDRYLGGAGQIDQPLAPPEQEVMVVDYQATDRARVVMPCISLDDRTCSFAAVEAGLPRDLAIKEAEPTRLCWGP